MVGLLSIMKQMQAEGRHDELGSLSNQISEVESQSIIDQIGIAIILRECALYDQADSICRKIILANPNFGDAYYQYALSCLMQGRHADALELVKRLTNFDADNLEALVLMARMQQRLGFHIQSDTTIEQIKRLRPEASELQWLSDLNKFLIRYPAERAYDLATAAAASERFLNKDELTKRIEGALEAKRGFSFIRLGDGEGAFIKISDADEASYTDLYRHSRINRSNVWFNGEIDIAVSNFTRSALELVIPIAFADVVGVPPIEWLKYDYQICSVTGMSSLVNALRWIGQPAVDTGQSLTKHSMHLDFYRTGHLTRILKSQSRVGVISCHAQAPDALRQAFGFDDVEFHKIPGEKLHAHLLGASAVEGQHFPGRYHEVMTALRRPLEGKLFLVAGGLLGKFYCDQIKRSGGVALDIGSLIDGWMGIDSRPGAGIDKDKL